MELFAKLEQKAKHLARFFKEPKYAKEMLDAIELAKTESEQLTRHAGQPRSAQHRTVAVTDIPSRLVRSTFGLEKLQDASQTWTLSPWEKREVPEHLRSSSPLLPFPSGLQRPVWLI